MAIPATPLSGVRDPRTGSFASPAHTGFALIETVNMHNEGRQFKDLPAPAACCRVNL
jgi:hypothetical protein